MRQASLLLVWVVLVGYGQCLSSAEPERKASTVEETREGDFTVLRVNSPEGAERAVYRLNLTKHHSPATARNDLSGRWESWRFGAFL